MFLDLVDKYVLFFNHLTFWADKVKYCATKKIRLKSKSFCMYGKLTTALRSSIPTFKTGKLQVYRYILMQLYADVTFHGT